MTALVSLNVLMYIQLYLPYTSHAHIIGGMKIVHAHPFSNDKNHDHDAASLLVIDLVSHQPAIVSTTPQLPDAIITVLPGTGIFAEVEAVISSFAGLPQHRGPPVFEA